MIGLAVALTSSPSLAQIREPGALAIEQRMVDAMGGRAGWEEARFFDFVFAVHQPDGEPSFERRHVWDRWTGRYKLEMPLDGQTMVAMLDVGTKRGAIWLDGRQMPEGPDSAAQLDRAHAAFINDTYWLLMPFKWLDPGVNLTDEGLVTDAGGKQWAAVGLSFEDVGRTPPSRYMAYVDPDTSLMGWWEHFPTREGAEATTRTRWLDWERRGPILVSLSRPRLDGTPRVYFPRVVISTDVDEAALAPPTP